MAAFTISRRENRLDQFKLISKGNPSHLVAAVFGSGAAVEISGIIDSSTQEAINATNV